MVDDMMGRLFVRVPGEGFDADQLGWTCECCGRDEYSCDCEEDDQDKDQRPHD